jgi:hypothetical protein
MLKMAMKPKLKKKKSASIWPIKNLAVISHQLQAVRLVVSQDMLTQS